LLLVTYKKLIALDKIKKTVSMSVRDYFNQFVRYQVSAGRYKNVSEVIRARLRILENEETKIITLKGAIQQGLNSPRVVNFDFDEHLAKLRSQK